MIGIDCEVTYSKDDKWELHYKTEELKEPKVFNSRRELLEYIKNATDISSYVYNCDERADFNDGIIDDEFLNEGKLEDWYDDEENMEDYEDVKMMEEMYLGIPFKNRDEKGNTTCSNCGGGGCAHCDPSSFL